MQKPSCPMFYVGEYRKKRQKFKKGNINKNRKKEKDFLFQVIFGRVLGRKGEHGKR